MNEYIYIRVNQSNFGYYYICQLDTFEGFWFRLSVGYNNQFKTIEEAFDAVVKHELKISQVEGGVHVI